MDLITLHAKFCHLSQIIMQAEDVPINKITLPLIHKHISLIEQHIPNISDLIPKLLPYLGTLPISCYSISIKNLYRSPIDSYHIKNISDSFRKIKTLPKTGLIIIPYRSDHPSFDTNYYPDHSTTLPNIKQIHLIDENMIVEITRSVISLHTLLLGRFNECKKRLRSQIDLSFNIGKVLEKHVQDTVKSLEIARNSESVLEERSAVLDDKVIKLKRLRRSRKIEDRLESTGHTLTELKRCVSERKIAVKDKKRVKKEIGELVIRSKRLTNNLRKSESDLWIKGMLYRELVETIHKVKKQNEDLMILLSRFVNRNTSVYELIYASSKMIDRYQNLVKLVSKYP